MKKVIIIGAGSWGTALGLILASKKYDVTLWEYDKTRAEEIQNSRENSRYLPGVKFPDNLNVTSESENLLKGIKYVIFSVPSQVLRGVISKFSSQLTEDMILVNTAKGIEVSTGMRLSEVMKDEIKETTPVYDRSALHEKRKKQEIGIQALRGGTIFGEHEIMFAGLDEIIEIKHTALSKDVFVQGALAAAKALQDKDHGLFTLKTLY